MKPKAILKRVICSEIEQEHKTEGGLYLPESHTKDQVTMRVVSKGEDAAYGLNVGDLVIVAGFQGHEIVMGEKKYKVFEDSQILCILDQDDDG